MVKYLKNYLILVLKIIFSNINFIYFNINFKLPKNDPHFVLVFFLSVQEWAKSSRTLEIINRYSSWMAAQHTHTHTLAFH